jgi:UDP-2,3-diacylglucosamine pyrophosphatase LpxH
MKEEKRSKRKVEMVVISDVHLGTYGCHAKELLAYLKSIDPKILVLNGDIVDVWQFSKWYWPKAHMKVVKQIIGMAAKHTKTYYITGNHDEMLRKFSNLKMGQLKIVNSLKMELDGQKMWFFHGDVFDVIIQHNKWLARLGAIGYDTLILLNSAANNVAKLFGRKKVSLSKTIKDNVKGALKHINNFEMAAAQMAMKKNFDYIICGHIHKPVMRNVENEQGQSITYLNSGDWIENLSALEYNQGTWSIYKFHEDASLQKGENEIEEPELAVADLNNKVVFNQMIAEISN